MTTAWALILAAGRSTRMGTCKTALPWLEARPLLTYQSDQLLTAGFSPLVVLGPHNWQQRSLCPPGVEVVLNLHPETGKTGSILAGLGALPATWQTLLISAVDQPRPAGIYQTLLEQHQRQQASISLPTFQGQFGHPVLVARTLLPALQTIQESSQGLRQVLRDYAALIQPVPVDTAVVLMDLNTPERYQAGLTSLRGREDSPPKGNVSKG